MKVFISWSGQLSKEIGEEFKNWLPSVLQVVQPYFTPDDVEKGARWASEIALELEDSQVGIILLTKESLDSLWISFEAGALSKQMDKSRICNVLFEIDNADLKGPLTQFQNTAYNKSDIKKLLETINNCCGEQKLPESVFNKTFELWWPKFQEAIDKLLVKYKGKTSKRPRTDRDILEEILELSRVSIVRKERITSAAGAINPAAVEDIIKNYDSIKSKLSSKQHRELDRQLGHMERAISYLTERLGRGEIRWYTHGIPRDIHTSRPREAKMIELEDETSLKEPE